METKVVFIGLVLTILILISGVLLLSRSEQNKTTLSNDQSQILFKNTSHKISGQNEKIILVEFADFQCPACKTAHPYVKEVLEKYKGKLTYIYRHFPLPQHKNGKVAAEASIASGKQGKFWEMYDLLYERQEEWSELDNPEEVFISYINELGLDAEKFTDDFKKHTFSQMVENDKSDGIELGVNSTPTFFLNGKKLSLSSFSDLSKLVEQEL